MNFIDIKKRIKMNMYGYTYKGVKVIPPEGYKVINEGQQLHNGCMVCKENLYNYKWYMLSSHNLDKARKNGNIIAFANKVSC